MASQKIALLVTENSTVIEEMTKAYHDKVAILLSNGVNNPEEQSIVHIEGLLKLWEKRAQNKGHG